MHLCAPYRKQLIVESSSSHCPRMELTSAAQDLLAWHTQHQRWPTWRDCCASQGLAHATTYLYWFRVSSLNQVMVLAAQYAGDDAPVPSAPPPAPRLKPCYNAPQCPVVIPDEGRHIRFCPACRRRLATLPSGERAPEAPGLRRLELQSYGYGRGGWHDE